jgi:hypothetical protein
MGIFPATPANGAPRALAGLDQGRDVRAIEGSEPRLTPETPAG